VLPVRRVGRRHGGCGDWLVPGRVPGGGKAVLHREQPACARVKEPGQMQAK